MLKGVCEIELRDENGDIVQKTKDKNMITDAINRLLNPDIETMIFNFGMYDFNLTEYYISKLPILDKMIGGIILFKETQEERIDNIIFDVSSVIGSGYVNTELSPNEPRLGVFNKEESAVIKNESGKNIGIKFVWDFATNQSNGTIRSVSLTTGIAAKSLYTHDHIIVPLSRSLNYINPMQYLNGKTVIDENISNDGFGYNNIAFVMQIKEDEFICVTKTEIKRVKLNRNLKLNESYYNLNHVNGEVLSSVAIDSIFENTSIIDLANYFTSYQNSLYYCITQNKILTVVKYDNITLESVKKTIDLSQYLHENTKRFATIFENYYVVYEYYNSQNNILFINKDDYSLVKTVLLPESLSCFGVYREYLIIRPSYANSNNYSSSALIIDKNLNIISRIKFSTNFFSLVPHNNQFIKDPFVMCGKHSQYNSSSTAYTYYNVAINPHMKFTIDNLATPVTKTASQTMKVIYTIQDVA